MVSGPEGYRQGARAAEVAQGATRRTKSGRDTVRMVWRVLWVLVARMDLGGMGPLVARALDPRRMTLARKDVAEYTGVAIPFYERWAYCHAFLLRGQWRGETVEEYF